jgi:hypothetical protein
LGAGGVGLHQRGTRARERSNVPAHALARRERAIREINRLLKLTTMARAPIRQVQGARLSEFIGENDRGRALKSVRVERGREVRHGRHGGFLPSPRRTCDSNSCNLCRMGSQGQLMLQIGTQGRDYELTALEMPRLDGFQPIARIRREAT